MPGGKPSPTQPEPARPEPARPAGDPRARPHPTLADKDVYTTGEAAELCKISQQTIIRCFDKGQLDGFRVPGSRFRRIPREALLRFMRNNEIPTDELGVAHSDAGPAKPAGGGTRRVLVVDDDAAIVEMVAELLATDSRFEVRTAGTGYDAGVISEAFRPELILLDYMLPDLNGNAVCASIRKNPNLTDTRVLIVSGVVNRAEIDGLMEAGADGFLKKPYQLDALLAEAYRLLGMTAGG